MTSEYQTTLPDGKMPQLRVMPMPADANVYGDVFGGWIMAQVDLAGSLPAVRRANGRVATIAVNSFLFKQPVFVGSNSKFKNDACRTIFQHERIYPVFGGCGSRLESMKVMR